MAWRPTYLIQAGELDNTKLGWTVGWLELEGRAERMQLKLAGNCHPDLAGWQFRIKRNSPASQRNLETDEGANFYDLARIQSGNVGDITADQRIKQFDIPDNELAKRLMAGEKPPFTWATSLYLEWYSNQNGRVVIQSTRLEVERIGQRAFELTKEQWVEQNRQNRNEIGYFMTQLDDAIEDLDEPV